MYASLLSLSSAAARKDSALGLFSTLEQKDLGEYWWLVQWGRAKGCNGTLKDGAQRDAIQWGAQGRSIKDAQGRRAKGCNGALKDAQDAQGRSAQGRSGTLNAKGRKGTQRDAKGRKRTQRV